MFRHVWIALILVLSCGLFSCSCNDAIIKDYELLEVPVAPNVYRPGRLWIEGQGPDGPAYGEVLEADGLQSLVASSKESFEANLEASVKDWLTASLSLDESSVTRVTLTGLRHQTVEDIYTTQVQGLMLWETVTAESIRFESTSNLTGGGVFALDPELLGAAPEEAPRLELHGSQQEGYRIEADRPLVVAIKVVRVSYDVKTDSRSLDIGGGAGTQSVGLGYRMSLLSVPDVGNRTLKIKLTNPDLIQWAGETLTLTSGDSWVSPRRQAIGSRDSRAEDADYIWDMLTLTWAGDVQIEATRNYVTVKPASSGLKGVR